MKKTNPSSEFTTPYLFTSIFYRTLSIGIILSMVLVSGCGPSLTEAACEGNTKAISRILHRGADKAEQEAALSCAVAGGHGDVVELLLQEGCPPTNDAMIKASESGRLDVLQALVNHGGNPNAQVAGDRVEMRGSGYILHISTEPRGPSALGCAVLNGHDRCVEFLLAQGANPNTPFIWKKDKISGVMMVSDARSLRNLRRQLYGADEQEFDFRVDATIGFQRQAPTVTQEEIATPLIVATIRGSAGMVKQLLGHGAAADLTDSKGLTALRYAETGGNEEIINLLKNHK